MKRISQIFLFGAPILILLAAACAPVGEGASALPGALQDALTGSPTAFATDTTATTDTSQLTATNTTLTPSIPVTGSEIIRLDCQYCVDNIAHAQLVIPREAKIDVVSPEDLASATRDNDDDEGGDDNESVNNNNDNDDNGDKEDDNGEDDDEDEDDNDGNRNRLGCRVVDKFRDTKLVLCRAEENTTITLNVCLKNKNCTEVQLTLQPCAGTATPTAFATSTATGTVTPIPVTISATVTSTSTTSTPNTSTPTTFTPTFVAPPTGTATNTPIPSVTNTPTTTSTSTSTATPTP